MFLLVSKFKIIGMLFNAVKEESFSLDFVHGQVQKKLKAHNNGVLWASYPFHFNNYDFRNGNVFDRMHFHLKERVCMIFYNHYLKMASCPKELLEH